jgi:hypothetical protein
MFAANFAPLRQKNVFRRSSSDRSGWRYVHLGSVRFGVGFVCAWSTYFWSPCRLCLPLVGWCAVSRPTFVFASPITNFTSWLGQAAPAFHKIDPWPPLLSHLLVHVCRWQTTSYLIPTTVDNNMWLTFDIGSFKAENVNFLVNCLILRSLLVQIWNTLHVAKKLLRLSILKYFGFCDRTNYNFISTQAISCVFDRSKKYQIQNFSHFYQCHYSQIWMWMIVFYLLKIR